MKYTKIITSLILAGAFVFSSSLMAADKKPKGKKGEAGQKGKKGGRQNPIMSLSGITAEQKKEIMALQKATQAKVKEAGQDRKARAAIYKEMQGSLKKILTEDQMKELNKKRAEGRKGKGGDKSKGKGKGKKKDA